MIRESQRTWQLEHPWWMLRRHRRVEVSLLVPFHTDDRHGDRARLWAWNRRYLRRELPCAEIIVGRDDGHPFSKTAAVNDAARRSHGHVLVILDADAYITAEMIMECVERIHAAERHDRRLWFVPYRRFYRLTRPATERVLESNPRHPYRFPSPPRDSDIEDTMRPHYGHHYGAMCMVMSAEAFWTVGGMDPRFRGWGAEDISFLHALDTLWGPHRTLPRDIFHLYHARLGLTWNTTTWPGQEKAMTWGALGSRFNAARHDRARMRALVDEGLGVERPESG